MTTDQLFERVCSAVREHMNGFPEPDEVTALDGSIIFACSVLKESILRIDVVKGDDSVLTLASCIKGVIGPCSVLLLQLRLAGLDSSLSLGDRCLRIKIPRGQEEISA